MRLLSDAANGRCWHIPLLRSQLIAHPRSASGTTASLPSNIIHEPPCLQPYGELAAATFAIKSKVTPTFRLYAPIREFCLRQRSPSFTSNGCVAVMPFVAVAPKLPRPLSSEARCSPECMRRTLSEFPLTLTIKNNGPWKGALDSLGISSDAKKEQCEGQS
jgi:hypothetical protein